MSNRTKFIIGIVLLLLVMFAIEYRFPRKFEWQPTFSHTDPQPFGCLVFDSVMTASMPQGYSVQKRSLWQMRHDSVFATPQSLLIVTTEGVDIPDINTILQLVADGHTVMVATSDLYLWCDTLAIDWQWNSTFSLNGISGRQAEKGLLTWAPQTDAYAGHPMSVHLYSRMVERTLELNDSVDCYPLVEYEEDTYTDGKRPVAAVFPRGKGELILVSAPLLFTNYMTVCGDGKTLVARLMQRLSHHPVVRTESYMSATAQEESSPFYVLLRQPPLRWALYLTMLAVVLFCFFTARRRQRVIPIVTKPQNRNLEFVRLIGTLYWQQHDNAGLLSKKLTYVPKDVRSRVDDSVREAASGNYVVTDEELKNYIQDINKLQQSL